jgi:hypothetical protein
MNMGSSGSALHLDDKVNVTHMAMIIYEQLIAALGGEERLLTTAEIRHALAQQFGTNPASVFPSDYCYNLWNKGRSARPPLFISVGSAEYRYVGPSFPYTGLVFWRPKDASSEEIVGEWVNGVRYQYPSPSETTFPALTEVAKGSLAIRPSGTIPLSREQLDRLYEEYMEILTLEVAVFGCEPTETRHLIGRLGEFYCARTTSGQLARDVNQAGFDVVGGNGRRISVKTTAQRAGFVSLNSRTADRADDLMVLRYTNGGFEEVYFGEISKALEVTRIWEGRYELDLVKARRIARLESHRPTTPTADEPKDGDLNSAN